MTAYGRASKETSLGRFFVEIQSVNRKFLEINCYLPKELSHFDVEIKKWIGEAVSRGQLNVKLAATFDEKIPFAAKPNIPLARQLKEAWDKIATELGAKGFSLDLLVNEKNIISYEENFQDEELYRQAIKEAVQSALKELLEMKDKEGKALQNDIAKRLKNLQQWLDQIAQKAPGATTRYRQKLIERLEEVLPGSAENEEKILREISIYAEKIDIAEETTRFSSHLKQFSDLLDSDIANGGKTLEFILQEMNREVNTIGSKSSDIEVSRLVIEIKSELERIREQIQNVE